MSKNSTPGVPGQEIDPSTETHTNAAVEPDLIEGVTETLATVDATMPRAERAAFRRELMTALRRAAWAAERLADLGEEEEPEPLTERNEEPPSGAQPAGSLPPPFAVLSNGQLLLNVEACPDLKLKGRAVFRGLVLSEEEAAYAMAKLEDVVHDVAGHLGGKIKRSEPGSGSGGDAQG